LPNGQSPLRAPKVQKISAGYECRIIYWNDKSDPLSTFMPPHEWVVGDCSGDVDAARIINTTKATNKPPLVASVEIRLATH
jgi:hypothetical protein